MLEPPWPSSVRSAENRASWLIREKTCVGPSTFTPDGNSKLTMSPYSGPGSDLAASHATMFWRSSGVKGRISTNVSSASPGRRIST